MAIVADGIMGGVPGDGETSESCLFPAWPGRSRLEGRIPAPRLGGVGTGSV